MAIWSHKDRQCTIIEFSYPADETLERKLKRKLIKMEH